MRIDRPMAMKIAAGVAVGVGLLSVLFGYLRMGSTETPELPSAPEERAALFVAKDKEALEAMTIEQLATEHFTRKSGLESATTLNEDTAPWKERLERVQAEYARRGLPVPK